MISLVCVVAPPLLPPVDMIPRGALALFLALQSAACSIFLPSPESAPPTEELNCAARGVPPVLDTLMATAGLVGGTIVIIADASSTCDPNAEFCFRGLPTLIIGIPGLLLGALYTLSALHGWHRNDQCQEHNAILARARNPQAGALGEFCTPGSDIWTCQQGLTCTFDRCVREGAPRAGLLCRKGPGIENAEICEASQRCVDGRCVSP